MEKWRNSAAKAEKNWFVKNETDFADILDLPFDILCQDHASILQKSGIIDWAEDLQHLKNQMSRDQPGSCDGVDLRQ